MYEELVKALRYCVLSNPCDGCPYYDQNGLTEKCAAMNVAAADAIEELCNLCANQSKDCSEAIAKYLELWAKQPRWISVTERVPELNTSCLLYNKYYGPMVGARIDDMRFRIPGSRFPDTPTHWMPLPEPPKEEK